MPLCGSSGPEATQKLGTDACILLPYQLSTRQEPDWSLEGRNVGHNTWFVLQCRRRGIKIKSSRQSEVPYMTLRADQHRNERNRHWRVDIDHSTWSSCQGAISDRAYKRMLYTLVTWIFGTTDTNSMPFCQASSAAEHSLQETPQHHRSRVQN